MKYTRNYLKMHRNGCLLFQICHKNIRSSCRIKSSVVYETMNNISYLNTQAIIMIRVRRDVKVDDQVVKKKVMQLLFTKFCSSSLVLIFSRINLLYNFTAVMKRLNGNHKILNLLLRGGNTDRNIYRIICYLY